MSRTSTIAPLLASLALGCASKVQGETERTPRAEIDYCTCEMWGVTGPPPPPDYQPPPRPAACERILQRGSDEDCPIPP